MWRGNGIPTKKKKNTSSNSKKYIKDKTISKRKYSSNSEEESQSISYSESVESLNIIKSTSNPSLQPTPQNIEPVADLLSLDQMEAIAPKMKTAHDLNFDDIFLETSTMTNYNSDSKKSIMDKFNISDHPQIDNNSNYGIHGPFNPDFSQNNNKQQSMMQSKEYFPNDVVFGANMQQIQNPQNVFGGNNINNSKSAILGKYHVNASNNFMTSFCGWNQNHTLQMEPFGKEMYGMSNYMVTKSDGLFSEFKI